MKKYLFNQFLKFIINLCFKIIKNYVGYKKFLKEILKKKQFKVNEKSI